MNTLSDWKKHDLQFRDKNFTKTKFYKIMNFTFQQLLRKETSQKYHINLNNYQSFILI